MEQCYDCKKNIHLDLIVDEKLPTENINIDRLKIFNRWAKSQNNHQKNKMKNCLDIFFEEPKQCEWGKIGRRPMPFEYPVKTTKVKTPKLTTIKTPKLTKVKITKLKPPKVKITKVKSPSKSKCKGDKVKRLDKNGKLRCMSPLKKPVMMKSKSLSKSLSKSPSKSLSKSKSPSKSKCKGDKVKRLDKNGKLRCMKPKKK
jgi:hypothetical protein